MKASKTENRFQQPKMGLPIKPVGINISRANCGLCLYFSLSVTFGKLVLTIQMKGEAKMYVHS